MKVFVVLLVLAASCGQQQDHKPRRLPAPAQNGDTSPTNGNSTPTNDSSKPDPTTPSTAGTELDAAPFAGSKVFLPAVVPAPAVVLLHGSEGGKYISALEDQAREFAAAGFVAMTLCWFDCDGLANKIYKIPLERTMQAVDWIRQSEYVRGKKAALFGWSRGAEQAVLIASLLQSTNQVAAVVANAPSDTIVCSYDPAKQYPVMEYDSATNKQIVAAAWSWKSQLLYGEKDPNTFGKGPAIQIEKYPGPLYLSHGTKDDVWEVDRSHKLEARRANTGLVTEAHYWQGEGHVQIKDPTMLQQYKDSMRQFLETNLK